MLQDSDCPKCKKESRVQNKYGTLILQSTRDGEALEKRIVELEAEMKDHKEHRLPLGRENGEVCFLKVSLLPFSCRGLGLFFLISFVLYQCTLKCIS